VCFKAQCITFKPYSPGIFVDKEDARRRLRAGILVCLAIVLDTGVLGVSNDFALVAPDVNISRRICNFCPDHVLNFGGKLWETAESLARHDASGVEPIDIDLSKRGSVDRLERFLSERN
jgi:hypothetical protein